MNTLFLMSMPVKGLLFSLLLLALCFFGIHLVILARLGWQYNKNPSPSPADEKKEEKTTPAEKPQEPIYYIVERKTRRAKPAYGEPKQIDFKPSK